MLDNPHFFFLLLFLFFLSSLSPSFLLSFCSLSLSTMAAMKNPRGIHPTHIHFLSNPDLISLYSLAW